MADPEDSIQVRAIEAADRFGSFSVGEDYRPLKTFLQKKAKEFESKSLARTYIAYYPAEPTRAVAYMTLVCGEIIAKEDDAQLVANDDFPYPQYPAVKIARLAVDTRFRRLGIGEALVDLALGIATDTIASAVGCRFVVVDAKRPSVAFYEKCGFTLIDTATNRERDHPVMFIDLNKATA